MRLPLQEQRISLLVLRIYHSNSILVYFCLLYTSTVFGLFDDKEKAVAAYEAMQASGLAKQVYPVSYTHLDVYKRQALKVIR